MNTIQRIFKNISLLFLSIILSSIFGFYTLIYSARYLGVEGFGILSSVLALTSILSVFMDLGLSTLIIRDVARDKSLGKEYIDNITTIKIILSLITLCIIIFILNISNYNPLFSSVIYFITLYTIFTTFSFLFLAYFQANEKMEYQSFVTILTSILLLAGVLLAMHYKFNIIQFSIIYTVVGVLTLGYTIIMFYQKLSLPKIKLDFNKWKELINDSWPFAITGISANIYTWIDTLILALIQGQQAVGLYNASYKLVLVFLVIPIIFNTAIFPLMSKYFISSKQSLKISFEKLFKIMMILAIPLGVGTVIIANKVILFIYGEQFIGAVIALQILIWSMVLIFIRSPFERFLDSTNKQLTDTKIILIGVVLNVILNLLVIPKYSFVGAAIITVLTDALVLGLLILVTKNLAVSILNKRMLIFLFKIIFASFVMGFALNYLLYINIIILIIFGFSLYIFILLLLKIFDKDELLMIKKILEKKK